MAGRLNQNFAVTRMRRTPDGTGWEEDTRADTVTAEEPLEIRVGHKTITTTMRTPGNDIELAHGFLHSEGHIRTVEDIAVARYCAGTNAQGENTYNVLDVQLANIVVLQPEAIRLTTMNSACGVCGTSSIEELSHKLYHAIPDVPLDPELAATLPDKLREFQKQFRKTGGIHAAGAFDYEGNPIVVREDIGRHNAADKVIGHLIMENRLPAGDLILVMSSRASFELVQKAAMAGFGTLIAVSAASSLAVETARDVGMNLVGFARGDRFNLYAGRLGSSHDRPLSPC